MGRLPCNVVCGLLVDTRPLGSEGPGFHQVDAESFGKSFACISSPHYGVKWAPDYSELNIVTVC